VLLTIPDWVKAALVVFLTPSCGIRRKGEGAPFDKDTIAKDVEINLLDKPILLDYYLRGWEYYR
jgi:hypothetical protein